MAIQTSYTDVYGATHTSAYFRVASVNIEADKAQVLVSVHHDANARSKADPTTSKPYITQAWGSVTTDFATYFADSVLDDDGKSPIKQAYAWVKTQKDFISTDFTTGTTDV